MSLSEDKDQSRSSEEPPEKRPKVDKVSNTDSLMPVGGKNTQFHCDYCQKDITRNIRVKCAVCTDFDLCIECFSVGVEISGHKKTHAYRISDCLSFPVLDKDWTADEELLMLEGIEMFGFGNWKDISEHVGTKTEKKCEQHYTTNFLNSVNAPEPMISPNLLGDTPQKTTKDADPPQSSGSEVLPVTPTKDPVIDKKDETTEKKLMGADIAGYLPLRGDFDVEHDNDAELILADMDFNEDDHATERELKLKVIDIYNGKLNERERRKKFVIERGLLDYKKHQQLERKRPKDERELVAQMRPFARFQKPEDHNEFVGGLLTAMRLRKRICQLQEYRRNGIRTLREAEEYEAEKKKRETEQALKKQRESASYLYESGRQSTGRERSSRWLNRDRSSQESSVGDSDTAESDKSKLRGRNMAHLDIASAPGADLLTPKEKELCNALRLLPKHYMVVKDTLIRESFRLGYLDKGTARQMIKIDVNKTGKIYDFFVSCGWVSNEKNVNGNFSDSPQKIKSLSPTKVPNQIKNISEDVKPVSSTIIAEPTEKNFVNTDKIVHTSAVASTPQEASNLAGPMNTIKELPTNAGLKNNKEESLATDDVPGSTEVSNNTEVPEFKKNDTQCSETSEAKPNEDPIKVDQNDNTSKDSNTLPKEDIEVSNTSNSPEVSEPSIETHGEKDQSIEKSGTGATEMKATETQDNEMKYTEMKYTEMKDTEMKDTEMKDTEMKDTEMRDIEKSESPNTNI